MEPSPRDRNAGIEAPVPDLLDQSGRLRRLGIALAIATLVGVIAATITYGLAGADAESTRNAAQTRGAAWRFIGYFTGLAWVITFVVAQWWLGRRSRRRDSLVARATLRK